MINSSKVVPAEKTLRTSYHWAVEREFRNSRIADLSDQATEYSATVSVPNNLQDQIARRLSADRSLSLDEVVLSIAKEYVKDDGDKHDRSDDYK